MKSRAPRLMSDRLLDLLAEKEAVKYRRGVVKAAMTRFNKIGDTKMESVYKNRYDELVKLAKEIENDIFDEVKKRSVER